VKLRAMNARYAAAIASLLCVAASMPGAARAERVVLGPASQGDVADNSVRNLAAQALADGLRMQGLTVTEFEEAKKALPRAERCDEACAARLLRAVGADLSAVVQLLGNEQGVLNRAQVNLVDAAGHRFDGAATVRDGDVRDATTRALLEARSYQLLGPGPWLRVTGTPEGAEVLVDGSVVGKLPYRGSIAAGTHRVVVRDGGYGRFEQALDVPAEDDRKLKLQVALEPAPIEAPTAALELNGAAQKQPGSERSHAWLAMPIAMGALGIGLAAVASVRIASGPDRCVDPDLDGRCTARRGVNIWPTVGAYALSAGLLGAGIVWIALGTHDEDQLPLAANIGIDHVSVAGSF
jgi:hypothetical protein